MKAKIRNIYAIVLGYILSLFGLSSCEEIVKSITDEPCMYGMPYSDFTIKGTVTDESKKPVQGIRIIVDDSHEVGGELHVYCSDTLYTDQDGKVDMKSRNSSVHWSSSVNVRMDDVDGEQNGGEFASREFSCKPEKTKDGKGWYAGAYELDVTTTLDKK